MICPLLALPLPLMELLSALGQMEGRPVPPTVEAGPIPFNTAELIPTPNDEMEMEMEMEAAPIPNDEMFDGSPFHLDHGSHLVRWRGSPFQQDERWFDGSPFHPAWWLSLRDFLAAAEIQRILTTCWDMRWGATSSTNSTNL